MKRYLLLMVMFGVASAAAVLIGSFRDTDNINVEETADEPAIDYVGVGS